MIYLDNAATSYPKPPEVLKSIIDACDLYGGNPGRASHKMAAMSAAMIYETRELIANLFGSGKPENTVFTHNATEALNIAIKGMASNGCDILISDIEHNSVRRAAGALARREVSFGIYKTAGNAGSVISAIEKAVKPNSKILVACHRSNICGRELPLEQIGAWCEKKGLVFIVDASQSAGVCGLNINKLRADAICAPGHKGLLGIMGSGVLVLGENVCPDYFETLLEGGSGSSSLDIDMPGVFPDRLEAGTLPVAAIASVKAGVSFINRVTLREIEYRENKLMRLAKEMLMNTRRVKVYAPEENKGSVLLFNIKSIDSENTAAYLNDRGICVRAGLHCAPLAHETVKGDTKGAVRASFGFFNSENDAVSLWKAVRKAAQGEA